MPHLNHLDYLALIDEVMTWDWLAGHAESPTSMHRQSDVSECGAVQGQVPDPCSLSGATAVQRGHEEVVQQRGVEGAQSDRSRGATDL